jgi:hypothetical protein
MAKNAGECIINANTRTKVKELFILLVVLVLAVFVAFFDVDKFREIIPVDSTMGTFCSLHSILLGNRMKWRQSSNTILIRTKRIPARILSNL